MSDSFKTELAGIPWEWDLAAGKLCTVGRRAIALWLDPSLRRLLAPLIDEVGAPLAALLIAYESSQGAEADYQAMVTKLGSTFTEGFLAWGRAVAGSGWGRFELRVFDVAARRAVVRVHDAWELRLQQDAASRWGCPFLLGKMIGIFSCALGVPCWADEALLTDEADTVEFSIYASARTIAGEIVALRATLRDRREAELRREIEQRLYGIRQNELQLRTMLRSAPSIVFSVDAQGIILVSEGAQLSVLGQEPGEVVGRSAFEVYKDYPDFIENLKIVLRGAECAWPMRLGDLRFECMVRPLRDEADEVIGAFGICTDVTLLTETEEQLRKMQRQLEAELQEKKQTIRALSTPGIRIWEGILLVPLIGAIDSQRGQQLMESLLDEISRRHTSHVLIDVTGVAFVDTFVANHLIKTVAAARLLGAQCVLVGISAEVAQSMVRLGVDLSQIGTHADLGAGLKAALASRHTHGLSQAAPQRGPRRL